MTHLDRRVGKDGKSYPVREPGDESESTPPELGPDNAIPLDLFPPPGKKPEFPQDKTGLAIEGSVAQAFGRSQELQDLLTAVSKVKTTVLSAIEANDPLFADIVATEFQADAGNLYRQLSAAMPYAACPYCRAKGCKACKGRGWVGRQVWDHAPAELKRR